MMHKISYVKTDYPPMLVNIVQNAAIQAGDFAKVFRKEHDLQITQKKDHSCVTFADLQANRIICNILQQHFPNIPIISEEVTDHNQEAPRTFFLVDPIDGTKSFIHGTNDYTVNIALIDCHRPVFGMIYIPEEEMIFYAHKGQGSHSMHKNDTTPKRLKVKIASEDNLVTALSPYSKTTKDYIDKYLIYPHTEIIRAGSAKKFTLIAAGKADFYPRQGPTGEWDTAAGDVLVHEAGGDVIDFKGNTIQYGKKTFINHDFIATSNIETIKFN